LKGGRRRLLFPIPKFCLLFHRIDLNRSRYLVLCLYLLPLHAKCPSTSHNALYPLSISAKAIFTSANLSRLETDFYLHRREVSFSTARLPKMKVTNSATLGVSFSYVTFQRSSLRTSNPFTLLPQHHRFITHPSEMSLRLPNPSAQLRRINRALNALSYLLANASPSSFLHTPDFPILTKYYLSSLPYPYNIKNIPIF
jgi:hypothetical protein